MGLCKFSLFSNHGKMKSNNKKLKCPHLVIQHVSNNLLEGDRIVLGIVTKHVCLSLWMPLGLVQCLF